MWTSRLPEPGDEGLGRNGEHVLLQRVCGGAVQGGVHLVEQPPQPQPTQPATSTSPSQVITRRAPRRSIQQQEEANTKYSFDSVVELFIYFRHTHCKTIAPSPSYVNLSSRIFSIPLLAVSAHRTMTMMAHCKSRFDSHVNQWSERSVI